MTRIVLAWVFACCALVPLTVATDSFMLVNGVTSAKEMCLAAVSASEANGMSHHSAILEECDVSIAAQDGREVWREMPEGRLASAVGFGCLSWSAATESMVVGNCSGATQWEQRSNGQLGIRGKDLCFSQIGAAVGDENVAQQSAATASSSALGGAHGPQLSVDGGMATYWASALGVQGVVHLDLDFGSARRLKTAAIHWEFPARSFSVMVRQAKQEGREIIVEDNNFLMISKMSLQHSLASSLRLSMREALASLHGSRVFGIRNVIVTSASMIASLSDCTSAANGKDARDKFFRVPVVGAPPESALRHELPSLQAAIASVGAATSELAARLPEFVECSKSSSKISHGSAARVQLDQMPYPEFLQETGGVDAQYGIDDGMVSSLLGGARTIILAARRLAFS